MAVSSRSRVELTTEGAPRAPARHCTSRAAEHAATATTSATLRIRSQTEGSSGSPGIRPAGTRPNRRRATAWRCGAGDATVGSSRRVHPLKERNRALGSGPGDPSWPDPRKSATPTCCGISPRRRRRPRRPRRLAARGRAAVLDGHLTQAQVDAARKPTRRRSSASRRKGRRSRRRRAPTRPSGGSARPRRTAAAPSARPSTAGVAPAASRSEPAACGAMRVPPEDGGTFAGTHEPLAVRCAGT